MKNFGDFDLMRVAGLRPKKDSRKAKYATFNQRMMAATIDSFFLLLFVAPLIDLVFTHYYPPVDVDLNALQQHISEQHNGLQALGIFLHEASAAGFIARWLVNMLVQTFILCIATAVCWHYWSATPGKILMRLRVADADTEAPINNTQIALRIAGYFISTLGLLFGFFWISFDTRRQAWHDKIANTVVLAKPFPWPWKKKKMVTPDFATDDQSGSPAP